MSDAFLSSDDFDEQAHQLYNEGRYDEALTVLKEGITLYPNAVELHIGKAYAHLAREEFAWSRRSFETRMSSAPRPLIVPAKTSSPALLSIGSDSPVTGAWLTALTPATTSPSSGTFSPGLTRMTLPGVMESTATMRSPDASRSSASSGGSRSSRSTTSSRGATTCAGSNPSGTRVAWTGSA